VELPRINRIARAKGKLRKGTRKNIARIKVGCDQRKEKNGKGRQNRGRFKLLRGKRGILLCLRYMKQEEL